MYKNFRIRNLISIFKHGSDNIRKSRQNGDTRSAIAILTDMASLYINHGILPKGFVEMSVGVKKGEERENVINELHKKNQYIVDYDENWRFLLKYSDIKLQKSKKSRWKRNQAYIKRYHMGKHCVIQYGVMFIFEHHHIGDVKIGDYVLFARGVDIDITGSITIGDGVAFSEGVKVLTHSHDTFHTKGDEELIPYSNRAYETPLVIGKNARIGAHAIIMPGVSYIGECAFVSAGAVVTKNVPDRVVVSGNPAQVTVKIPKSVKIENRVKSE